MFKERDIMYEREHYWVLRIGQGHFEVLRNTVTHSIRVATIHFSSDDAMALRRAIAECDRRESK